MRPIEVILAVILATVVVMDVKLPAPMAAAAGSVPGMVVILGVVFYLFSQSTVLGVLGVLAGFIAVQHSGRLAPVFKPSYGSSILPDVNVDGVTFSPMSQFPVTLEETIVKNLVPIVNAPGRGSISTSFGNTHDAADV
jgi:hypothetical protein